MGLDLSQPHLGCVGERDLESRLRRDMLKAAENLELDEGARLRDELRRLEAVGLAIADAPFARQSFCYAAEVMVRGPTTRQMPK